MRELSLHILDILQNAVEAGATLVELTIEEDLASDRLTIVVRDNGRGIPADVLPHVFDPFYTSRTTRRVGLGLPLLKAAAERCAGDVTIVSEPGGGTTVQAVFQHSHLDRAPLGDIVGALLTFMLGSACDLAFTHRVDGREFTLDTRAVAAVLEETPLSHPQVVEWLRAYIAEGEVELYSETDRVG